MGIQTMDKMKSPQPATAVGVLGLFAEGVGKFTPKQAKAAIKEINHVIAYADQQEQRATVMRQGFTEMRMRCLQMVNPADFTRQCIAACDYYIQSKGWHAPEVGAKILMEAAQPGSVELDKMIAAAEAGCEASKAQPEDGQHVANWLYTFLKTLSGGGKTG